MNERYGEPVEVDWRIVSSMSFRTGVMVHFRGYVGGKLVGSRMEWRPDDPDEPPPVEMRKAA